MRAHCKNKVIEIIRQIEKQPVNINCRGAMLIVDDITGNLLSSVVKDFFALGVLNITKIHLKKQPRLQSMGIYYINKQSIPHLIQDFAEQPIFHSINLLMPEEITTDIMKRVGSEKKIMQRLAFFGELKLNIRYLSAKCGLICEEHKIFKSLVRNDIKNLSESMAQKLIQSIICGYGDNFNIRIYYTNFALHQQIIKIILKYYEKHRAYLQSIKPNKNEQQQAKEEYKFKTINLVLIERTLDLISPLVRNYYYITMVSDIFQVDFLKKDMTLRDGKAIKLNFEDVIFEKYKNLHISKAQTSVQPDFKAFQLQNEAAKMMKNQKNLANLQLKHIIRDIPQYNRKVNSFQQQISIMDDIKQISKEQNLPELGQIQQMIVSGISGHGQQVKDSRIIERTLKIAEVLKLKNFGNYIKLLVLLLMCVDMDKSTRKDIIQKISQQNKYPDLNNFLKQTKVLETSYKARKLKPVFKKQKSFLDIHQSLVSNILCELIEKGNSKLVNLTVIGQNKKQVSKFESMSNKQNKEWLICMAGGIALNQICQLQRLEEVYKNNIINVVSTEILTTWNCLQVWSDLYKQEVEL